MMFFMMSGMSNMSGSRTEGAPKKPSIPTSEVDANIDKP